MGVVAAPFVGSPGGDGGGGPTALADALRRAEVAHGRHEAEIGQPDPDWPACYAQHLADESAGPDTGT